MKLKCQDECGGAERVAEREFERSIQARFVAPKHEERNDYEEPRDDESGARSR